MIGAAGLQREVQNAFVAVGAVADIAAWPEVPLAWNKRLRRAGRALIEMRGNRFESASIELSPTYFEVYPDDLPGILVHEAAHVALAMLHRPSGHGPVFRALCEQAGGLLHSRWLPGRVFTYRCPICARILRRRRRLADARWCPPCVRLAAAYGQDPYARGRAFQLLEVGWAGPEDAARIEVAVCDSAPGGRPAIARGPTPET